MPAAQNPVPSRSEKAKTGIYIARGADTLGPYDPDEAEALVVGGYLHVDDHAARNGDTVWVPLTEFLPPSFRERLAVAGRPVRPSTATAWPRWRWLTAAILGLAVALCLAVGGMRWHESQREVKLATVQPTPASTQTPIPAPTPAPAPTSAAPVVEAPPTDSPSPEPDGPVRGSLDLPLAGVQVAAYPLDTLETALAPVAETALIACGRLNPQVEAASAELATRTAEEQAALRALNDAAPSDPLRRSLRFAYNGARTATRTAADNQRFLLDERSTAAGGETFFHALPAPTLTAETNADGSFTLDLPPDGQSYVVAASVRQPGDDGTAHTRRWLVRLAAPQRSGHAPLRLDDTNTLTSASEDSLVRAAD